LAFDAGIIFNFEFAKIEMNRRTWSAGALACGLHFEIVSSPKQKYRLSVADSVLYAMQPALTGRACSVLRLQRGCFLHDLS
jgi:hypothetical protein